MSVREKLEQAQDALGDVFTESSASEKARMLTHEHIDAALNELSAMERDHEATRSALNKLVDAMDACRSGIEGAFHFQHIHGGRYSGPTYNIEMEEARAILGKRESTDG